MSGLSRGGRFSVHVQVTWRILSDLAGSSLAVGITWLDRVLFRALS